MKAQAQRVVRGQHVLLGGIDPALVPEWREVQQVIQRSLGTEVDSWSAFAPCRQVEIFTDGSAPIKNPGGPAGFSAIVVGFLQPVQPGGTSDVIPDARLELAGYIPGRTTDPQTSNNRAEMAGVLAALEALRHLTEVAPSAERLFIWSDSELVVRCGNGVWGRKKNVDLWQVYDAVESAARRATAASINLAWLKGHAGHAFNSAADELASRAALNFVPENYARLREAQAATGREMPGLQALAPLASSIEGRSDSHPLPVDHPLPPASDARRWLRGAHYTLAVLVRLDNTQPEIHKQVATGHYCIWTKDGRSRQANVPLDGRIAEDEGAFRTLIAALQDVIARIVDAGREPGQFRLTVYLTSSALVEYLNQRQSAPDTVSEHTLALTSDLVQRFNQPEVIAKPLTDVAAAFSA